MRRQMLDMQVKLEEAKVQAQQQEQQKQQAQQELEVTRQEKQQVMQTLEQVKQEKDMLSSQKAQAEQAAHQMDGMLQKFQTDMANLQAEASKEKSVLKQELDTLKAAMEAQAAAAAEAAASAKAVPYLDFESLTGLLGELHSVSLGEISSEAIPAASWLSANITEHWLTVTEQAMSTLDSIKEKAATLRATAAEAAQGAAEKATLVAQDLHKQLEPHIGEHVKAGMEAYKEDLEPHVETAKEVASAKLLEAQELLKRGSSTLLESSTVAMGSFGDNIQALRLQSSDILDQSFSMASEKLSWAMSPSAYQLGGKTIKFSRGLIDIVAAGAQILLLAYLLFIIVWRIFLRTLLWKLGLKFVGRNTFKVATGSLRLAFSFVRLSFSIVWGLFLQAVGVVQSVTSLSIWTLIFLGIVYGIEVSVLLGMGVGKGLKLRYRLLISGGLGLLVWFSFAVRRCSRKAKSSSSSPETNGKSTNGKAKAAAKTKAEAKKSTKK